MKKVAIILIFVFTFLLLTLCACQGETDTPDGDSVSFTDALDRDVCVKKDPKRVCALIGSFADVWMLSGGTLCAAPRDASEDFGIDMTGIVNIGGAHSPSLELVIASEPDLVLASASTVSNVEMLDTLTSLGITVVFFDVDNFGDYLSMLDICTQVTGRRDLYKKNGTDLLDGINAVKARYASDNVSENERRVLLLRASSGSVKAKGSRGTILGEMLSDMGCVNIADSDKSLLETLSVEAVIASEPHYIFVTTMGNDSEAARDSLNSMINSNPAWSTLSAVKDGRMYIMDKKLFNLKPNARWAEAYEVLYEALRK